MQLFALVGIAALAMAAQRGDVVDLDGRRIEPLGTSPGVRATALVFLRTDCPIANQAAPEIERIREAAATRGVRLWLVYVDPRQSANDIRAHMAEYGLSARAIRDLDHSLVRGAGVSVTPEAALYVHGSDGPQLVYRGRLDDRVTGLGKMKPRASKFDLREAMDLATADRAQELISTPAVGCVIADLRVAVSPDEVTFTRQVAPIVFAECAPCHRPGGAGPFPLTSYAEVRRRARQIVEVTRDRIMPPWPPVDGHGVFKGQRRLDATAIATLAQWVEHGSVEGDARDLPAVPAFTAEWPLGTPDLVLTPSRAWTLPAEGGDVFRNFVLPVPLDRRRFVRAIEIRPGNARILHHANALPDRSGVGRRRDALDPEAGFAGMDLEIASDRFEPDSHFLFWKPGTPAQATSDPIPWAIEPGADLILNLHLRTSGKPEQVRPSLGLYFTDRAPTRFPMLLQLERDGALDIPAGAAGFSVTDELELPVAVQVLAVYPHAHYVAREVQALARRPDGSTEWLVHIADWNLDWQAVYELAMPLSLPKGSVISMRWTYDNSARNERNPHHPPQRVIAGNRASDEMSHLWVQVLPERREDLPLLQEALMRARLRKYPGDFVANANLGALLLSANRTDEAMRHLQDAVAARPDDPAARNSLGTALLAAGRPADAIAAFTEVVRASPDYLPAHYNLGNALLAAGRPDEAIAQFQYVLDRTPQDAAALSDLGSALAMTGRMPEAERALEQSLSVNPANAKAHYNLGLIAAQAGRMADAESHFERALAIDPSDPDIAQALAQARAARRR